MRTWKQGGLWPGLALLLLVPPRPLRHRALLPR